MIGKRKDRGGGGAKKIAGYRHAWHSLQYGTPFVAKFNEVKYLFNPIILA